MFKKLSGDIIYSNGYIPLFGNYILDLESYESLNRFSRDISENIINKLIVRFLLSQKKCKKIILWSESAKISFKSYHGNRFDHKLEVVYPSILVNNSFRNIYSSKSSETIDILFVGRFFERKGGYLCLEVANNITKKYRHTKFVFVGNVDKSIIDKHQNKQILFLGLLPRNETIDLFKKSHIYFMPTFYDTFGMVFLEAFAYGCVPIALDDYSIKEIIDNGKDGFIIKGFKIKYYDEVSRKKIEKYNDIDLLMKNHSQKEKIEIVNKSVEKIRYLIDNKNIMKQMAMNGLEKVKKGKFSIGERNRKLLRIIG